MIVIHPVIRFYMEPLKVLPEGQPGEPSEFLIFNFYFFNESSSRNRINKVNRQVVSPFSSFSVILWIVEVSWHPNSLIMNHCVTGFYRH